jgi:hypothetical protein
VWLLPDANRPVVSIFSISKLLRSDFARRSSSRRVLGFLGTFEDSVQLDNEGHSILFLTPWWIWHL